VLSRLKRDKYAFNYPIGIFVAALLLIAIGIVMVYASSAAMSSLRVREPTKVEGEVDRQQLSTSLSAAYLKKQTLWAFLGIGTIIVFYGLRYSKLRGLSVVLLGLSFVLLLVVLLIGKEINGARRWLNIGPFGVQPSELAKLAMVLFMARFICDRGDRIHSFIHGVMPGLAILGSVMLLVFIEPDYGATAVLGMIVLSMWFVAGFRKLHLVGMLLSAVPAFVGLLILSPVRYRRLTAFLDLETYRLTSGYQVYQSLIALGSGGPTGVGLGRSMQKFHFLTEAHTDFIVAIIGEELGLVGLTAMMLVYAALFVMGMRVAYQTPDFFGMLVAYGLTAMIAFPTLINIGVATSCLPAKGLALPFISYGGSSMLVNCAAIGVLMNIAAANYGQSGRG
jgi:cell division protein FtsW